jgi:hypothetical protein
MKLLFNALSTLLIFLAVMLLTSCGTSNAGRVISGKGGLNAKEESCHSPTVTNILVQSPPDRSFVVGDIITNWLTAQGCDSFVQWSFTGLPDNWASHTNDDGTATVSRCYPIFWVHGGKNENHQHREQNQSQDVIGEFFFQNFEFDAQGFTGKPAKQFIKRGAASKPLLLALSEYNRQNESQWEQT